MSDANWNLSENGLKITQKNNWLTPTPIQQIVIPPLKAGESLFFSAPTGTGKTLAYLLPILEQMNSDLPRVQWIVLAPTHELAAQIHNVVKQLAASSDTPIRSALLVGGANLKRQIERLKTKPTIVVGTVGRILEHIQSGKLKLSALQGWVIDEADRMVRDPGTERKLILLKKRLPQPIQCIASSATGSDELLKRLAHCTGKLNHLSADGGTLAEGVDHFLLRTDERNKSDLLRRLLHALNPERAMIFVQHPKEAKVLQEKLEYFGLRVQSLHNEQNKFDRKKSLDRFRAGRIRLLILSEMGARGLDISGVSDVINYNLPFNAEAYLHRAGRTGRAGASGRVFSLVTEGERKRLRKLTAQLDCPLTEVVVREGGIWEPTTWKKHQKELEQESPDQPSRRQP